MQAKGKHLIHLGLDTIIILNNLTFGVFCCDWAPDVAGSSRHEAKDDNNKITQWYTCDQTCCLSYIWTLSMFCFILHLPFQRARSWMGWADEKRSVGIITLPHLEKYPEIQHCVQCEPVERDEERSWSWRPPPVLGVKPLRCVDHLFWLQVWISAPQSAVRKSLNLQVFRNHILPLVSAGEQVARACGYVLIHGAVAAPSDPPIIQIYLWITASFQLHWSSDCPKTQSELQMDWRLSTKQLILSTWPCFSSKTRKIWVQTEVSVNNFSL